MDKLYVNLSSSGHQSAVLSKGPASQWETLNYPACWDAALSKWKELLPRLMAVTNLTIFGQDCQMHFFAFGFFNINIYLHL